MVNCCLYGCKSRSERNQPNTTFHRFPIDPFLRNKWIDSTGRANWHPSRHSRICSRHFEDGSFRKKLNRTHLNPRALPTLYIQAQVTAEKSNSSQQANECQQPSESSRTTGPPKHYIGRGVQDHDYHQPIISIRPRSTGPTEQGDQLPESKEIIFNVYHFLQDEYKRLKQFTGDTCDLSPLAHILGRTAEATGVSEQTVSRILWERKRPRHGKEDRGETKHVRLSQNESVSSPIEQDTRSSISTDSDPNADDIVETNEGENETGTLKLKFEVDEEYSEAGSKRLVMTIDPLTVQSSSTGHQIPCPEMDPDEMDYIHLIEQDTRSSISTDSDPNADDIVLIEQDTRSSISTDSDPNADDIVLIEQDTRSSISTDSDPNADDIVETNEGDNETGTLKLKFEVDEEYSEAGSKRLVMMIDPLTVQSTSTVHQIPSPEMDPDEMDYIQSTSSVHHELSPTHPEVKLEPSDTQSQQSTSYVQVELSPTHSEVKLEPSETPSQHEDPSLALNITPVLSKGDHFTRGAVLTISNHRKKKSD